MVQRFILILILILFGSRCPSYAGGAAAGQSMGSAFPLGATTLSVHVFTLAVLLGGEATSALAALHTYLVVFIW